MVHTVQAKRTQATQATRSPPKQIKSIVSALQSELLLYMMMCVCACVHICASLSGRSCYGPRGRWNTLNKMLKHQLEMTHRGRENMRSNALTFAASDNRPCSLHPNRLHALHLNYLSLHIPALFQPFTSSLAVNSFSINFDGKLFVASDDAGKTNDDVDASIF